MSKGEKRRRGSRSEVRGGQKRDKGKRGKEEQKGVKMVVRGSTKDVIDRMRGKGGVGWWERYRGQKAEEEE